MKKLVPQSLLTLPMVYALFSCGEQNLRVQSLPSFVDYGRQCIDSSDPIDLKSCIYRNQRRSNASTKNNGVENRYLSLIQNRFWQELAADPKKVSFVLQKYTAIVQAMRYEEHDSHRSRDAKNQFPLLYHPLETAAIKKVTDDFGTIYLNETTDGGDSLEADQPWAGHWYPFRQTTLYDNEDSPMAKFDRLIQASGRTKGAVAWEKAFHDSFGADSWEGLCDAWSAAAILTKEPRVAVTRRNISFSNADQKALLTKLHEKSSTSRYGISYKGDSSTDGTFQDIRPEGFHKVITAVLGEQKKAVIMDDDPGVEVWNKPLYRVRLVVVKDPAVADAFFVKAFTKFILQRSAETNEPTSDSDILTIKFEYRLYYDPQDVQDNRYRIVAGEWLNESFRDHPDIIDIPQKGLRGSSNTVLNQNIDIAEDLLKDLLQQ